MLKTFHFSRGKLSKRGQNSQNSQNVTFVNVSLHKIETVKRLVDSSFFDNITCYLLHYLLSLAITSRFPGFYSKRLLKI